MTYSAREGSREGDVRSNGADRLRGLYDSVEGSMAAAMEEVVAQPNFGRLLALAAGNVAAVTRLASDGFDLALRNLRVAGRADVVRLSRQLQRTEDKLERVLQEIEQLRDEHASPPDR